MKIFVPKLITLNEITMLKALNILYKKNLEFLLFQIQNRSWANKQNFCI